MQTRITGGARSCLIRLVSSTTSTVFCPCISLFPPGALPIRPPVPVKCSTGTAGRAIAASHWLLPLTQLRPACNWLPVPASCSGYSHRCTSTSSIRSCISPLLRLYRLQPTLQHSTTPANVSSSLQPESDHQRDDVPARE